MVVETLVIILWLAFIASKMYRMCEQLESIELLLRGKHPDQEWRER